LDEFSLEIPAGYDFPPAWPPGPTDIQIQANLWRRVMAMQVSHNTWRLEFNEATDAWRTFFFQVQFQGPDDLQSLEFTSEVQTIPTKRPFPKCEGEGCQGQSSNYFDYITYKVFLSQIRVFAAFSKVKKDFFRTLVKER
jgi:hypothetical protein